MNNLKNKSTFSAINLMLMLTFAAMFFALPIINAQDAPSEFQPTYT
jgi:hypothetical protein